MAFRSKTENSFDDRDNFVPKPGKYELIVPQSKEENEEDGAAVEKVRDAPSRRQAFFVTRWDSGC